VLSVSISGSPSSRGHMRRDWDSGGSDWGYWKPPGTRSDQNHHRIARYGPIESFRRILLTTIFFLPKTLSEASSSSPLSAHLRSAASSLAQRDRRVQRAAKMAKKSEKYKI